MTEIINGIVDIVTIISCVVLAIILVKESKK